MKKRIVQVLVLFVFFLFSACDFTFKKKREEIVEGGTQKKGEIIVYAYKGFEIEKALIDEFTKESGILVSIKTAGSDQIIQRLAIEEEGTPADLLIVPDVGRLFRAESKGLFQKIENSDLTDAIPQELRDKENYWFGLCKFAYGIAFSNERVDPQILYSYESLAEPQWNGKILTKPSVNISNQVFLSELSLVSGIDNTQSWVENINKNKAKKSFGNDGDLINDILAGKGDVAIVNSNELESRVDPIKSFDNSVAEKIGFVLPDQEKAGALMNVIGGGVIKFSDNPDAAAAFLNFLVEPENNLKFARQLYCFPLSSALNESEDFQFSDFKENLVNLNEVESKLGETRKIFDEAEWDH
ncbi:extracellular solute-binding protein [Flexithrix dorotheae]|uniref:extracellular solute-binding protein n=1 Tax=Flexithrix dorotheae TaxID=70993 RepID=UPI000362864D|nr:extracellular solute-binding protein [Flexithrix dorotheae]